MALNALLFRDIVNLSARGHTTRQTLHAALLEVRDRLCCPVCNDRDTVTGGDECALSVDHVAVTITVTRRAELDILLLDTLNEIVCVCKVRVWVSSAEIGERNGVLDGGVRKSEGLNEDGTSVGTRHTMHTIEEHTELVRVGKQERLDKGEVEDRLEQLNIVLHGVDNVHLGGTVREGSNLGEVKRGEGDGLVASDRLRLFKNLVGHALWCRTTVRDIVFDTEIIVGTSRIVTSSEEDTTVSLILADDVRGRRGGKDGILADDELGDTIGRTDLQDSLHGFGSEEPTITTDDKGSTLGLD